MARIALTMMALGMMDAERCEGCKRVFERGEIMTAVEYDDGDPAGWFCPSCIQQWNETIAKGITPQ